MALLTKDAVDEQINLSFNALAQIELKYNVNTMRQELESQIRTLQNKERVFLDMLNAPNIKVVNDRLKQLRQAMPGLQNLSGPGLEKVFLQPVRGQLKEEKEDYRKRFIEYFTAQEGYRDFITPEEFRTWFLGVLNQGGGSFSSAAGLVNTTSLEQIIISKLSKAQQKKIGSFLSQQSSKQRKATIQTTATQNTLTHTLSYEDGWIGITGSTKGSDVQEMLKNGTMTQSQLMGIINNLENYIISSVSSPVESSLFNSVVHEVLYNPQSLTKIFYGGNMINGITGLLGEIQGLYIVRALMGAGADRFVQWTGGIKNPHEDLVASFFSKGAFQQIGIQIKNSAKDIEAIGQLANVSFTKKTGLNITEIKNRLGEQYEDILKIYEMDAFNVGYDKKWDDKQKKYIYYRDDSNPDFRSSRQQIEELSRRVDRTMALFAASLMYMSASQELSQVTGGNCIFLLGGTVFQLASEILIDLFNKLNNEAENLDFKISSYFKEGTTGVKTIVGFLNSEGRNRSSISGATGKVFLQSSYTFTI